MSGERKEEVLGLSIHDLIRRSTYGRFDGRPAIILSIHDLTRRSTQVRLQR